VGGRLHSRGLPATSAPPAPTPPPDLGSYWSLSDVAAMLRDLADTVERHEEGTVIKCSVHLHRWHESWKAPDLLRVTKGKRQL
jgi:hypothetical protein